MKEYIVILVVEMRIEAEDEEEAREVAKECIPKSPWEWDEVGVLPPYEILEIEVKEVRERGT